MIVLCLTQQEADALEALLRHFELVRDDLGAYDAMIDDIADACEQIDPSPLANELGARLGALEDLVMSVIALRPRDLAFSAVLMKLQSAKPVRRTA